MSLIEEWLQTVSAEQMSTLNLHRVPHGIVADGALVSFQQRVDKLTLIARHDELWWQLNKRHDLYRTAMHRIKFEIRMGNVVTKVAGFCVHTF